MALSGGCSMCFTDQQLITESLSSSHSGSETCRRETTRPTNQKSHSLRVASLQPQNMNKTITHDRAHTLHDRDFLSMNQGSRARLLWGRCKCLRRTDRVCMFHQITTECQRQRSKSRPPQNHLRNREQPVL